MLSNTYQQQSDPRPDGLERDPENRLLWRFNRQRLDFEAMRDSVLAVSGALGPDVRRAARRRSTEPPFSSRRTLYGFIDRQNLDGVYRTFDFAVPDATSPRRFVTTVPQQALFLMNSPFLHEQARRLSSRASRRARIGRPGGRPAIRPRACAGSIAASSAGRPRPTSWPWRPSSSAGRPADRRRLDGMEAPCQAARATEPQLSPWEQLSQVLLLDQRIHVCGLIDTTRSDGADRREEVNFHVASSHLDWKTPS